MKVMHTRPGVGRWPDRGRGSAETTKNSLPEEVPAGGEGPARVQVRSAADVLAARKAGRLSAIEAGFSDAEVTSIVTAISEVTRNMVEYAHSGEVVINRIQRAARRGLEIVASDKGPGIRDVRAIMEPGASGHTGASMGLSRAKWLMDTFEIVTKPGRGTTITMVKWLV
jgi:serine/threonine-protein kinase RsbT